MCITTKPWLSLNGGNVIFTILELCPFVNFAEIEAFDIYLQAGASVSHGQILHKFKLKSIFIRLWIFCNTLIYKELNLYLAAAFLLNILQKWILIIPFMSYDSQWLLHPLIVN